MFLLPRLACWQKLSPLDRRNSSCIGCGASRPAIGSLAVHQLGRVPPPQRFSPRFSNMEPSHDQTDILIGPATHTPIHHPSHTSKSPVPIQLTPSGTQICMGGKVRNISNDALAPCYMFWSFNEPLPDQGQIRPALAVALQHPPILNTGNRGPIEHQPGDWICKKCNYLNWRRRKVCQTCYPCMVSSLHMPIQRILIYVTCSLFLYRRRRKWGFDPSNGSGRTDRIAGEYDTRARVSFSPSIPILPGSRAAASAILSAPSSPRHRPATD